LAIKNCVDMTFLAASEIAASNGALSPLDGFTNLKYKLLYFLTPYKKNFKEKGTSFSPG
jgi:hypothetical protein